MNPIENLLNRKKLILTLTVLLALNGLFCWMTMIRQEDPRLPDYWGQVISRYPGGDAETVERLVLEPLEDALLEVDALKEIKATAFDEVAVLELELNGGTADFKKAWDDVREALDEAYPEFPQGALPAVLNDDLTDQDSVVLAVSGSSSPLDLLDGARKLKDSLLALHDVSRVSFIADPGEQVTVALDDAAARRIGLDPVTLSHQLSARSRVLSGGSLSLGGKRIRLRPLSEFASVDEIAATPVSLASGSSVPLREIAQVRLGPEEPALTRMRFNGESCMGLAVVPRRNINLVTFGDKVREIVEQSAPRLAPLKIQEVAFQPKRTGRRLADLSQSLMLGIIIVAGILILVMGFRLGLVVASVVPLVAAVSLAVFAWGGGVLHQISIAALVLALGMLVDNAIVMAENIQWRLDRGEPAKTAAAGAVKELGIPLAGATATTLAAFVPMLISRGPTAEFTQTIPILIMITLSVSYLFAVFVTPVMSEMALTPRTSANENDENRTFGHRLGAFAASNFRIIIFIALILVIGSLGMAGKVRRQFFPTSDRNQILVDLKLPEGTHLDETDHASRRLERMLLAQPEVTSAAGFMGRSAPHFYYNVPRVPFSPHFAQLIVEVRRTKMLDAVIERIRDFAHTKMPEAELVARKLEQGPPVDAPVEVRLFGRSLADLHESAGLVLQELKKIDGARDVRHDLGPGAPTIRFVIDDAAAARYGLNREGAARSLYGRTRGLPIGELYTGEDPIPVVIRSSAGEQMQVTDLAAVSIPAPDGRLIPLAQVARMVPAWRPAALKHRDGRRVVTVSAQLAEGAAFSDVLNQFSPRLKQLTLPEGIDVRFGGDAEGAGEANSALLKAFPIGLLLLFGVLLTEFNSFRRVFLVLMTVPFAAAGVIPGLLLGEQPFGFMSMLGIIALVGIVVNNAIVLLEVIEDRRRQGVPICDALADGVSRRIRPILLTTATTVAGLLPLAFSSSTLWPPLAFAMISGLTASTFLSLMVVPAMYRFLFRRDEKREMLESQADAGEFAAD